jgi:hypothetical protein
MAEIIEDEDYLGKVPGAVAHRSIKRTDNGLKDGDLQADQTAAPLEIVDGKPKGWEAPDA